MSLIISIYTNYNYENSGYQNVYLLPLLFAVISLVRMIWIPKGILIIVIDCIYFVRLVAINFMVVYSGWYEGRSMVSPTFESYHLAVYLLLFECIIVNIFYYFLIKMMILY